MHLRILTQADIQQSTHLVVAGMIEPSRMFLPGENRPPMMADWDWYQGVALFGLYRCAQATGDEALLVQEAPGCAITEQTDGFLAFDLEGPEAAVLAVLEKLVNIDLRAFGPGYATRTGLHHMAVFVIRRGAGKVSFLGMRSAAGSLWHALASAAARQDGLMG